jgi:hypothetical protein
MRNILLGSAAALTMAGALVAGATSPSAAAPVPGAAAAINRTASSHVIDVAWRGRRGYYHGGYYHGGYHRGGWGWGAPFAAGIIAGGIAAGAYPYYYGRPYYYGPPPEAVYVEPPPVYVAPGPAYYEPPRGPVRQCWVKTDDRNYGYWRPC